MGMKLKAFMEQQSGLSQAKVAKLTGYHESTISQLINGKYSGNAAEVEADIFSKLADHGYKMQEVVKHTIDPDAFIHTENYKRMEALCNELIDPAGTLSSSLGAAIGRAGRGKTFSFLRYVVNQKGAIYVKYIDGYSRTFLTGKIAYEFGGVRPATFGGSLSEIGKYTGGKRRLIVIDEADLMPQKLIDTLRGINEEYRCPIIFVGEEALAGKLGKERRTKSRIRQTIYFDEISMTDVSAYYKIAANLQIDADCAHALHKRAEGDFRIVVLDALDVARMMTTSGLSAVTLDIIKVLPARKM